MKTILALSRSDFQSTFRDPIFRGLLVFPIISFGIIRWLLPYLVTQYPALAPYRQVILMWACLQTATMFGFIYGFLILEEKEERLWEAIRLLPVSGLRLMAARLLLGMVMGTLVNLALLHSGRIISLAFYQELLLAGHFSLAAPLIALMLGAMARNRIEGLALMKIINVLLILPGIIYFLPHPATHITALIPTYWSFRSLETATDSPTAFFTYLLPGTCFYLLVIGYLNKKLGQEIIN